MKIFVVTPWFPVDNQDQSGNYILDSVRALRKVGANINILVSQPWVPIIAGLLHRDWSRKKLNNSIYEDEFGFKLIHYFSVPRNYLTVFSIKLYLFRTIPVLTKQLQSCKADVIHAHTEYAGLAAVEVGKKLGIPVVVTMHGINTAQRLQNDAYKTLLSSVLSDADRVVMVGKPLIRHFSRFVNDTKNFAIVHNGFRPPPTRLKPVVYNSDVKIRFISVSNLHEGKGVDLNLLALAGLTKMGMTNWQYTVVGDGSERSSLENLSIDLGISQRVRFVGGCQHNKVYEYLLDADVFTLPSYREAFGIAYLEAMACGLLTIGVDRQGAGDIIKNKETGFLLPPKDVDALIECFKMIYESDDFFKNVSREGYREVRERFTWGNHAKELMKLYTRLIEHVE